MAEFELGQALIDQVTPVVAGSNITVRYSYVAGHPIDDTGYLKIVFRFAGDFGMPQFSEPSAPNYCAVSTTANCRVDPRWDAKGHTRPWGRALFLKVMGGFVDSGEEIHITFGDRTGGSPGWQTQTFCETSFEFKTLVDPVATYQFKELETSPTMAIVAGPPSRMVCIAPSHITTGTTFDYHIKTEDRWGNPTGPPYRLTHSGFDEAGIQTIEASDSASGLTAKSNPIDVSDDAQTRWWADFHGQSEETVGTNSVEAYFGFARDFALVDIAGHQGNDFQITESFWQTINDTTATFHAPGSFVTFPGYEWSGNTPLGGDRNVFYASEGRAISRSCGDLVPAEVGMRPHSRTAEDLFAFLKSEKGVGSAQRHAFVVPHVGGRYSDLAMHSREFEWNVEVHSAWGTFEWLAQDAFRLGYRVGICANSDGHKGRPGASYPGASKFGSYGGLTCVLSEELTRESVMSALQARHCYATTGNRSLVDVRLKSSDGVIAAMGDVLGSNGSALKLHIDVTGTGPVERVDVMNGIRHLKTLRPYTDQELGQRLKIIWAGAEVRGRDRAVTWDGDLTLEGTEITDVTAVNFWNQNNPLVQTSSQKLSWRSITTGGLSGFILTLDSLRGSLAVNTTQGRLCCDVNKIGYEPILREYGGINKQISIFRLPDQPSSHKFTATVPIDDLAAGDNPIYIRVTQEDGHMAWTSPIYVTN
ncbi:MAG: DUF3604 domain-containing protein [Candidatus Latescibacteria bacterium]|nr:DUF3604 domain-containing protein [Candidatus Latescibacterota bacterium]